MTDPLSRLPGVAQSPQEDPLVDSKREEDKAFDSLVATVDEDAEKARYSSWFIKYTEKVSAYLSRKIKSHPLQASFIRDRKVNTVSGCMPDQVWKKQSAREWGIGDDSWRQARYDLTLTAISSSILGDRSIKKMLEDAKLKGIDDCALKQAVCSMMANVSGKEVEGATPEQEPRQRYKQFLSNFRRANTCLTEAEKKRVFHTYPEIDKLLNQVARSLFMARQDSDFHTKLVQKAFVEGRSLGAAYVGGRTLAERLKDHQQRLLKLDKVLENADSPTAHMKNKVSNLGAGELGINYDPYMQGNTPYSLFRLTVIDEHNNPRPVECIRMGTPTCQKTPASVQVIPEFRRFVSGLENGEYHLYINRQKRSGVEGGRSKALENFPETAQLTDKLTVVTLPADGDLYNQEGRFQEDCSFDQLKQVMVDHMVSNTEGFYFPPALVRKMPEGKNMKSFLARCFDTIKGEVGAGDERLSSDRRRAIIFHFLNKALAEALVKVTAATTYNNTCKDDIDRGGMANAYMYAVSQRAQLMGENPEVRESFLKKMDGVTFAPAMIVKKRAPIQHRFDDLANALVKLPAYWGSEPEGSKGIK